MNTFILMLAVLTAGPNLPPNLDMGGNGAVSPIVSLIAWDKGGSQDWGAGIPSPTIDCAPLPGSTDGDLVCSGANPTKQGNPTTAGSPIWYRGDTAVRPAVVLDGTGDQYDAGDVADATTKLAVLFAFKANAVTGLVLAAKDEGAGGTRSWIADSYNNTFEWGACNAAGCTGVSAPAVYGSWHICWAAFDSGTLRTNCNGTAGTPGTLAGDPMRDVAISMFIGSNTLGASDFNGSIRRVSVWNGADAPVSAAQGAALVASQWGLAADRPSGTVATHARSDSTLCCPFSDAECYWVGPGAPCIHAPTYQGWASGGAVAGGVEVYGPGANALGYSETFANAVWIKSTGVTAADASASCPMSPLAGTRMSLVTTDGEADQIAQDAATTPGRAVWLARATGDSACGVTFADADGTGAQSLALTDGPLRYWSGGTGQTGLSVARPVGGCARWCMWLAQATAAVYPVPPRSTPGATAYGGSASTATTLTVPVAPSGVTDASGAVAVAFTAASPVYPSAILGVGSDWLLIAAGATGARAFDGTTEVPTFTVPDVTAGATLGVAWSGAVQSLFVQPGGVVGSHAYDGAFVAGWAKFSIGARADGTYTNPGLYRRFAQCRRAGGCR